MTVSRLVVGALAGTRVAIGVAFSQGLSLDRSVSHSTALTVVVLASAFSVAVAMDGLAGRRLAHRNLAVDLQAQ